jgi:lipopolysaccharide/colanic/teichoic acid biosynthesis glycosyltransferase
MRIVADIALLNGCRVVAVMPSETVAGHEPMIVWEGDRPLVQLLGARHTSLQYALKRAIDVIGASIGLVILTPLFTLIALALRMDSAGPALFRHRRVGLGGRSFDCLKFRSMVADAEDRLQQDPSLLATYRENNYRVPDAADPRVTRVGRLLRRSSLDELPQLWNVLRGDMSLIGPRPVVTDELTHFAGSERLLLSVRPGMTGMWAVMGRHEVAYPARAEIELRYVRSWSLRGDAVIALKTVGAVMNYGSDLPN